MFSSAKDFSGNRHRHAVDITLLLHNKSPPPNCEYPGTLPIMGAYRERRCPCVETREKRRIETFTGIKSRLTDWEGDVPRPNDCSTLIILQELYDNDDNAQLSYLFETKHILHIGPDSINRLIEIIVTNRWQLRNTSESDHLLCSLTYFRAPLITLAKGSIAEAPDQTRFLGLCHSNPIFAIVRLCRSHFSGFIRIVGYLLFIHCILHRIKAAQEIRE